MRAHVRALVLMLTAVLALTTSGSLVATASAERLVAAAPATGSPHVLDGKVLSIAAVGDTVVLGGTFTQAREEGSDTVVARRGLLAFDRSTGRIDPDFAPVVSGGEVAVVLPAPEGDAVYVGGKFTTIAGRARPKLAKVRLADGSLDERFDPGRVGGPVADLRLHRGRLFVAGAFSDIAGHRRRSLATLHPATGRFLRYADLRIAGVHNGGYPTVMKIDITPRGNRLVAIGNFRKVNGKSRPQVFVARLAAKRTRLMPWRTAFYAGRCSGAFYSYMRDVDISPDGRFFVVVTTGGHGPRANGPCDSAARFETRAKGNRLRYSWLANTGGDTVSAVLVTDEVAYVGGHERWWNNPYGKDAPARGAVPRSGIAALSTDNGLPYSWDPGRSRGVGVFDFLLAPEGLWFTSDTEWVAGEHRGRVALMPAGGTPVPDTEPPARLDDVYIGAPAAAVGATSPLVRRPYAGGSFGQVQEVAPGDVDWEQVSAAFMADGQLYTAGTDGGLTRRSFGGEAHGAARPVDTADGVVEDERWHQELAGATSLFLDSGRLYYTLPGRNALYMRYFNPESDVVGAVRRTVATGTRAIDYRKVRGMFRAGGQVYWAEPNGALKRLRWKPRPHAGTPVGRRAVVVSSPRKDNRSWSGGALFVHDVH